MHHKKFQIQSGSIHFSLYHDLNKPVKEYVHLHLLMYMNSFVFLPSCGGITSFKSMFYLLHVHNSSSFTNRFVKVCFIPIHKLVIYLSNILM